MLLLPSAHNKWVIICISIHFDFAQLWGPACVAGAPLEIWPLHVEIA